MNQLKHYVSGTEEWLYMYDADDERLFSFKPGVPGQSPRFDRWTIRDLAGKVLRTYEATGYNWSGSVAEDDIWRDSLLLAAETPSGVRHFSLDHLGTPRLITNAAGGQTAYHVYYPFGEEATAFNQDTERFKFTGHERDLASSSGAGDDLDYMHARHYSPVTGRFVSVDAEHGSEMEPQSWNRFHYARSSPQRFIDPDGRLSFDTVEGYANAFGSDLAFGLLRHETHGADYAEGQRLGDEAAQKVGAFLTLSGPDVAETGIAIEPFSGGTSTAAVVAGLLSVPYGAAITGIESRPPTSCPQIAHRTERNAPSKLAKETPADR